MKNHLSRVVDMLPGLVWTALPDGRVDYLNERWFEYTGVNVEQAYGSRWQTAIHPEDLPELHQRWRAILDSCEAGEIKARLRRFDGAYRWFLFRTCPLADASGHVVKWFGVNTDIEDRSRAEEALRESEGRYRSIVDSLPALVTLLSADGHVEHANRYMLEYLGTTYSAIKDWSVGQCIHPDDRPEVLAQWARSVELGHPCDFEVRLQRGDGAYRWFHTRGLLLRNAEGRVDARYFLQTDIDDRKRADALLAGEKKLLEMVALGCSLPVVLDSLCRLVEDIASGCHCCVLLLDPSGATFRRGAAPSLPSTYYESKDGRPVRCESGACGMAACLKKQVIVPDVASDTRWDEHGWRALTLAHGLRSCWSTPILSRSQEVLGTFAIYQRELGSPTRIQRDLIDQFTHIASIAVQRARSDSTLRQSESFLAEAQHVSRTGSFLWRMATGEIMWSDQLYRIFGINQTVPLTLDLIESRIHPEDFPLFHNMIDRAREAGSDEGELRLQMPDQSIKNLYVVAHRIRDQEGQLECTGAVQDVTQRRAAEEALGQARSELAQVARLTTLGVLTASIAHEVNQPLSGILTNASTCLRMLAADPPNVDGARETARRTIRDGNRAADVIGRLRALFDKKATTAEPVDLNEAAREVIALAMSKLRGNRVILRLETADELPLVTGDRVQLQQVIMNLIVNASDAMSGVEDRPRHLVIKIARDEGDRVRLAVQDTGTGLEPTGRLFEAFYTTKKDGMGIGLSVSRSIIESHRGRIWAAANDGPGATFAFSIPCVPESVTGIQGIGANRMHGLV
jgi:PAS domain S-box-containing protein